MTINSLLQTTLTITQGSKIIKMTQYKKMICAQISTLLHLLILMIGMANIIQGWIIIPSLLIATYIITFLISFCMWAHYDSLESLDKFIQDMEDKYRP